MKSAIVLSFAIAVLAHSAAHSADSVPPTVAGAMADSYLKAVSGTLSEWSSPEDEEAFRDL